MAPRELFLKRQVRTRLDLLRPDLERRVCERQAEQKWQHHQHAKQRELFIGQKVMAKNLRSRGPRWVPGVVVERLGPLTYLVLVDGGLFWRRHVDLLRKLSTESENNIDPPQSPPSVVMLQESKQPEVELSMTADYGTLTAETNEEIESDDDEQSNQEVELPQKQYPKRNRQPPLRLAAEMKF